MHLFSLISVLLLFKASTASAEPCTVLANGYDTIDDAPAINNAIQTCGNGGTIILPASQNYSIHSAINFQDCHGCDVQIEGRLIASVAENDLFHLRGASDVTVRSLTGSGVIDGNAYDYWWSRWDSGDIYANAFAIIHSAHNIHFSNLYFKDVKQHFFRVQNSTSVSLTNLKMTVDGQWGLYPRASVEVSGIDIGNSSDIYVSNVNMTYRTRKEHSWSNTGLCIPLDAGSQNVLIQNITCTGAFIGVLSNLGAIPDSPHTPQDPMSNITIRDVTFTGDNAAGFLNRANDWDGGVIPISDIMWDGINVVRGSAGAYDLCYQAVRTMTAFPVLCHPVVKANISRAVLRRVYGNVGSTPPTFAPWNNNTFIDVKVEDWGVAP